MRASLAKLVQENDYEFEPMDRKTQAVQYGFCPMPATEPEEPETLPLPFAQLVRRAQLDAREIMILRRRFGFEGEIPTFKAIGLELKVCKERVRQIERKALEKLFRIM